MASCSLRAGFRSSGLPLLARAVWETPLTHSDDLRRGHHVMRRRQHRPHLHVLPVRPDQARRSPGAAVPAGGGPDVAAHEANRLVVERRPRSGTPGPRPLPRPTTTTYHRRRTGLGALGPKRLTKSSLHRRAGARVVAGAALVVPAQSRGTSGAVPVRREALAVLPRRLRDHRRGRRSINSKLFLNNSIATDLNLVADHEFLCNTA